MSKKATSIWSLGAAVFRSRPRRSPSGKRSPSGAFDWHTAPVRQLVITLSGTLRFETRGSETFVLRAGDVLLAEDTTGSGHRWSLVDDQPWRRVYVVLPPDAEVPFVVSQCPIGKD